MFSIKRQRVFYLFCEELYMKNLSNWWVGSTNVNVAENDSCQLSVVISEKVKIERESAVLLLLNSKFSSLYTKNYHLTSFILQYSTVLWVCERKIKPQLENVVLGRLPRKWVFIILHHVYFASWLPCFLLTVIEHLPQELRDRFTEMRELDLSVQSESVLMFTTLQCTSSSVIFNVQITWTS